MSKHHDKLEQNSPAKPEIEKDKESGALHEKDLDMATGGVSLNYQRIEYQYTNK